MKLVVLGFLALFPLVGTAQKEPTPLLPGQVRLSATQEIKDGGSFRLRGHVEIETGSVIIYTDEAEYDPMTGALNPYGHVHIKLKNATLQLKIQDSNPQDTPVSDGK
jgi:lipopolysaccharide assembly outer membrane protein LptD (OstA)